MQIKLFGLISQNTIVIKLWSDVSLNLQVYNFSFRKQKRFQKPKFLEPFGGDKRDRTADLLNAIQALSRSIG